MGIAGWTPDWNRLYNDGRCKYHEVAWSDAEQKIIQESTNRQETINMMRDGYIETHKAEIIDPMSKVRQDKVERDKVAEEYEIVYGKKPHHFATIATMKKKIAEKDLNQPLEEPKIEPIEEVIEPVEEVVKIKKVAEK